jgi:hypothetical protein
MPLPHQLFGPSYRWQSVDLALQRSLGLPVTPYSVGHRGFRNTPVGDMHRSNNQATTGPSSRSRRGPSHVARILSTADHVLDLGDSR